MDKKELRKKCLERRRDTDEKEEKSKIITSAILENPNYQEAKIVALYNSMGSEVDTKELIKQSILKKNVVLLPKVKDKRLIFVKVDESTSFELSNYNIEEPISDEEYLGEIDLMIVPGVAFTKEGKRLGYGGGYYDRYLEGKNIPTLALAFESQIVEEIPSEDHDILVDVIQTEKKSYDRRVLMEKYDTLKFYNDNAEKYCEQTRNGDMSESYNRFLMLVKDKAYILDFGCGSGRDSKYFLEHGYTVDAIDGSERLAALASEYIGQEVKCMKFDELNERDKYDGIWACSSILHVERESLPDILQKMITALKDDGVIYTSFKLGDKEYVQEGKYYNNVTREILEGMLAQLEPPAEIVEYSENSTASSVKRPTAQWGNYLIKKKGCR